MYQEELIEKIKAGVDVKHSYQQLFFSNYGLIYQMAEQYSTTGMCLDDCMQLAYVALHNAVQAYSGRSKYSFLSFFRRCLQHEFYVYKLEMCFPCRVPRSRAGSRGCDKLPTGVALEEVEIHCLDFEYRSVENQLLSEALWKIVDTVLTAENCYIVKERFVRQKTLQSIGKELGIGAERVRMREKRALKKLRENEQVREIARMYYF